MRRPIALLILLLSMTSVLAQKIHLDLRGVSLAYALTRIDEAFGSIRIQFIIDETEGTRVDAVIDTDSAIKAVREVIGGRSYSVKEEGNNIFVSLIAKPNDTEEIQNTADAIRRYYLEEVLVTEQQPIMVMPENSIVLNIENSELKHRGNAVDLIAYLPGIRFSDGQISVYDNSTPVIYIDDVLVDNSSELFSLRSEEISRIALLEGANSTYHAQSGTVIKIYTTASTPGWNVLADATVSIGERTSHREGVKVGWNSTHWQILGGLAYQDNKEYQKHKAPDFERVFTPDVSSVNPYFQFSYRWNLHHRIGFKYEMMDIFNKVAYWSRVISPGGGSAIDYDDMDGLLTQREWMLDYSPRHNSRLFYVGRWNRAQVNFDLEHYTDQLAITQKEVSTDNANNQYRGEKTNGIDNDLWAEKLEVKLPLGKTILSFGNEYTSTKRIDSYQHSFIGKEPYNMERSERQMALFALAEWRLPKATVQVGLRNENMKGKASKMEVDYSLHKSYLLPHINVDIPLGESMLSVSYSERSQRPSYNQLNGYSRFNQNVLFVSGNPDLKPALHHHFNLQFKHKELYASVKYQNIKDYISSTVELYDGAYNLIYSNVPSAKEVLVNAMYSPKFDRWTPILSASLLKQNIELEFDDRSTRSFNRPVFFVDFHCPYTLGKNTQLWTDVSYHSSGHIGTSLQNHSGTINFGVSHQIGMFDFSLRAEDILKTGDSTFELYGQGITYRHWTYSDSRRVVLSIKYRIK